MIVFTGFLVARYSMSCPSLAQRQSQPKFDRRARSTWPIAIDGGRYASTSWPRKAMVTRAAIEIWNVRIKSPIGSAITHIVWPNQPASQPWPGLLLLCAETTTCGGGVEQMEWPKCRERERQRARCSHNVSLVQNHRGRRSQSERLIYGQIYCAHLNAGSNLITNTLGWRRRRAEGGSSLLRGNVVVRAKSNGSICDGDERLVSSHCMLHIFEWAPIVKMPLKLNAVNGGVSASICWIVGRLVRLSELT